MEKLSFHVYLISRLCSTSIFDKESEISRMFNFVILSNSQNSETFMHSKITWFTVLSINSIYYVIVHNLHCGPKNVPLYFGP